MILVSYRVRFHHNAEADPLCVSLRKEIYVTPYHEVCIVYVPFCYLLFVFHKIERKWHKRSSQVETIFIFLEYEHKIR